MDYTAKSSGLLAAGASQAVAARSARLLGLMVNTDGTNACTVIVYDNPSAASGTIVAKMIIAGGTRHDSWTPVDVGVEASTGLFITVAGTGSEAIAHYALL